jgi:DNA excision repair protein ERCC-4
VRVEHLTDNCRLKATWQMDVEELSVENALFRSFDAVLRSHIDLELHKIGPKTRQLSSDLTELRKLL